jgi:hypothetical protein
VTIKIPCSEQQELRKRHVQVGDWYALCWSSTSNDREWRMGSVGVRSIYSIVLYLKIIHPDYFISCPLSCLKADGQMNFYIVPKVCPTAVVLMPYFESAK